MNMRDFLVAAVGTLIFVFGLGVVYDAAAAVEAPNGEAAREIVVVAPTQNVDGTVIDDLAELRLYWGFAAGAYDDFKAVSATAGETVTEPVVITVLGSPGDEVTVFYAATAVDAAGNESGFSNEISETFLIVDASVPLPPEVKFNVPVAYECATPAGGTCSLIRVASGG